MWFSPHAPLFSDSVSSSAFVMLRARVCVCVGGGCLLAFPEHSWISGTAIFLKHKLICSCPITGHQPQWHPALHEEAELPCQRTPKGSIVTAKGILAPVTVPGPMIDAHLVPYVQSACDSQGTQISLAWVMTTGSLDSPSSLVILNSDLARKTRKCGSMQHG